MLRDIRIGSPHSCPSYFTVFESKFGENDAYLMFSASDGFQNEGKTSCEGIGGSQLWRTDGTHYGTKRVFDKTSNDLSIDRAYLDKAYPRKFGYFPAQKSLYVTGNYGYVFVFLLVILFVILFVCLLVCLTTADHRCMCI
jgi:ELWxxDGT repeat protein